MKKMKKALSLLLVLSMVLSMSFTSAFAAEDSGDGIVTGDGGSPVETGYATVDELEAAFEAVGETDDVDSALAALDAYLAVYDRLSPEDQEANAEGLDAANAYRETLVAAKEAGENGDGSDDGGEDQNVDPDINTLASKEYKLIACAVIVDSNNKILGFDPLPTKKWRGTTEESASSYCGNWSWSPNGNRYQATALSTKTNVNVFPYVKYPSYLWDTTGYTYLGWKSSQYSIDANGKSVGSLNSTQTSEYYYEKNMWPNNQAITVSNSTGTYLWYVFRANTNTFTLNYNGNKPAAATGDVTNVPAKQEKKDTTDTTWSPAVSYTEPQLTGYTFKGWYLNSNGTGTNYSGGDTVSGYSATANPKVLTQTLYAKWEKDTKKVTLTYDANGGTNPPTAETKDSGSEFTIKGKQNMTHEGWKFLGWNTNPEATAADESWEAGDVVVLNENIILYAVWKKTNTDPGTQTGTFTVEKAFTGLKSDATEPNFTLTYEAYRTKDGQVVGTREVGTVDLTKGSDGTYTGTINPTVWQIDNNMAATEQTRYKNVVVITEADGEVSGYEHEFKLLYQADGTVNGNVATFVMNGSTFMKTLSLVNQYTKQIIPEPEVPNLIITKTVDKSSVKVGGELEYTIKVENNGTAPATNVTVMDNLPTELGNYIVKCDHSFSTMVSDNQCVFICNLGIIAAKGSAEVKFTVKTQATGKIENNASVTSTEITTPVNTTEPAETVIYNLVVTKNNDHFKDENGQWKIDTATGTATVRYTVTVKNESGFDLHGLDIIDTLRTPEITATEGTPSVELTLKPVSLMLGNSVMELNKDDITLNSNAVSVNTWNVLDRSVNFEDDATVTLVYDIAVKNTGTTAVYVGLNNTAKGGSWTNGVAPANEGIALLSDDPGYDATDEATSGASIGSSESGVVIPPPAKETVTITIQFVDENNNPIGKPTEIKVEKDAEYNVTDETNTIPQGYERDDSKDITGDVRGTADSDKIITVPVKQVVDPKTHTVTWIDGHTNTQIGEVVTVEEGNPDPAANTQTPPDHTGDGYQFTGWTMSTDDNGNITYTANYTENSSGGGGGTTNPPTTPPNPTNPTDPATPTNPDDPTVEIDDPNTPLAPNPDEPDDPTVDIDEPDTPLAGNPDEDNTDTEIDDEDVPLAGAPKTGDDFQLWTWIALVMTSGAGLAWLALADRKRRNAVK